jgi:dTDP-4-dehydrorhamnose 3,5-epimerase
MPVSFIKTDLPGAVIIEPAVFNDARGFFLETYHYARYAENGISTPFVQDNHSHSVKGTLRGLHYQLKHPQGKLIYVIRGEIYDVAVDIRKGSPFFGKWVSAVLSDKNKRQFFIPPGFAHGFCVTSEEADVTYKCTDLYSPGDEYGIAWDAPDIGIKWPVNNPLLSEKDSRYLPLKDTPEGQLPVYQDN